MSTLRPKESRSGRERSRSRNRESERSRDTRPASVVGPPRDEKKKDKGSSKSSKSSRLSRYDDDEEEQREKMPGGFDDRDSSPPRRREANMTMPGLSSIGSSALVKRQDSDSQDGSESDSDRDTRQRSRNGKYEDKRVSGAYNGSGLRDVKPRGAYEPRPSYHEDKWSSVAYPSAPYEDSANRVWADYSKGPPQPGAGMPYPQGDHTAMPIMPGWPAGSNDYPPQYQQRYNQQQDRYSPYAPQPPHPEMHRSSTYPANPAYDHPVQRTSTYPGAQGYDPAYQPDPRSPDRYADPRDARERGQLSYPVEPPARSREGSRAVSFAQEQSMRDPRPSDKRGDDERRRERKSSDDRGRRESSSTLTVNGHSVQDRAPSPARLGSRMDRLSISGGRPEPKSLEGGKKPPGSPLLEAYRGTYQTASPMPSPMMLPGGGDSDISDLSGLSASESVSEEEESASEEDGVLGKKSKKSKKPPLTRKQSKTEQPKSKKRVTLFDAEGHADTLAKALNRSEARPQPLIQILPELTHDQLLALRDEYKKRVKVQGRGVNISKQIKAGTSGNFGKVCYVTSLGRWESESYWANFWYQSHSSNRELLIEALMGRTNAEIREIKESFKDKRYYDDLSRCLEKELKPDKFRTAILWALEAKRQEETDNFSIDQRNRDVETLHRALTAREGGESAILEVVVRRSDNHLREVLKAYERMHESNFAREALRKSNNLVGEVIAHILNGVINRPARDCLLLRHAVNDVQAHRKENELRYELLISRLVRLHWDRKHLGKVKQEYESKYKGTLEEGLESATRGDFQAFLLKLVDQ